MSTTLITSYTYTGYAVVAEAAQAGPLPMLQHHRYKRNERITTCWAA
uniref:Uncharacterized protein n=1 Tax=Zea mays TaxID=4577 RepID=C4IZT2_MAIZE|nr:unknown [Zea mays]